MQKTAIIAGATGLVGQQLLQQLLDDDAFEKVKALVRQPLSFEHPKLEPIQVNFDRLVDFQSQFNADCAFCCLGTTIKKAGSQAAFRKVDFDYVVQFAECTLAQGATDFLLVSAMGAKADSLLFYNRVKGEAEDAVKQLGFRSVHIFRPSLLLGNRSEKRLGEDVGKVVNKWLNPLIPSAYKGIEAKVVAKAMRLMSQRSSEGVQIYLSDVIQKLG